MLWKWERPTSASSWPLSVYGGDREGRREEKIK